jgi:integrase
MASLVQDASGNYLVTFRWGGRQPKRSLGSTDPADAAAGLQRVEHALYQIKNGYLVVPADETDPVGFIVAGGKATSRTAAPAATPPATLGSLFDAYFAALPDGAKGEGTVATERTHGRHLTRVLGAGRPVAGVTLAVAQGYVTARGREKWRGETIGGETIKKEIKTLRAVWSWGNRSGHVPPCPWLPKDLMLPRGAAPERFRTYVEIDRIVGAGGLTPRQERSLWKSLFLDGREVSELIDFALSAPGPRFVGVAVAMAALTGARRSELCRSRIEDIDLARGVLDVREKKRDHSHTETIRPVEIHDRLAVILADWLDHHPGGRYTLAQDDGRRVSWSLARTCLRRTLKSHEKWRHVRGYHVLRHSFASILASHGVDQRLIDAWMGHQTEEQRQRYQHLFATDKRKSIACLLT